MDIFAPTISEMQDLCQRNADDLAFLDYCRQRTKVVEAALEKLVRHVRENTGQEPSVSLLARTLDETAALLIDRLPDVSTLSTRCAACGGPFIYQVDERTAVNQADGDAGQWLHVACLATAVECKGCAWQDLCPGCDVELSMTSGGKKQCRRCGFLLTCCDTV